VKSSEPPRTSRQQRPKEDDINRILSTHAGSIIRPPELLDFVATMERGEQIDEETYAETLSRAVTDVVRRQAEVGIDVVDDGEMGKSSWITYLYERTSGIEPRMVATEGGRVYPPSRDRLAFPEFYVEHDRQQAEEAFEAMGMVLPEAPGEGEEAPLTRKYFVTGPLVYDSSALQRDIANFKQALDGVDVVDSFLPVVAPASAYWLENEHYATEEEFVFALADALHEEYKAIVDAGFLLQVDDAVLVHEYDSILSLGGSVADYRKWAELRVEALNHALSGIPEDRVRYHICHGSWHGPHVFDPPLGEVIDLVLKVKARYYLFEHANARHEHEWRLWEDVKLPDGKVLVPGVVSHHTIVVEHPELVAERLVRLARLVGPENVMGGTDCGFAQGAFLRRVHPSIQWAKLEAIAEGARLATKQLSAGKSAA
jgi:5-methyltetrahydropteroyltriglutamate--homocysteine methyltransferase